MAKRRRTAPRRTTATTAGIDTALTHLRTRLHTWHTERTQIAAEIQRVIDRARALLREVSDRPTAARRQVVARKGGRPKGFKVSAATRAKLRAAWTRRRQQGKPADTAKRKPASKAQK